MDWKEQYADGNLTNAGALLADESPVRHSRLFCTRWNGLTKASGLMDALDDEEYTGGLVELLQDGLKFVKRNSKKTWKKLPDRSLEGQGGTHDDTQDDTQDDIQDDIQDAVKSMEMIKINNRFRENKNNRKIRNRMAG